MTQQLKRLSSLAPNARPGINSSSPQPLNVWAFVPNTHFISRIRILGPLEQLQKAGRIKLRVISLSERQDLTPPTPDIAVLGRVMDPPNLVDVIYRLKEAGTAIIYEIDDNLLEIPPHNPDYLVYQEPMPRQVMIKLISLADALTVSTPALRDALAHYNPTAYILPNQADMDIFTTPIQPVSNTPVVAGFGGTNTHGEDFKAVVPAIQRVLQDFSGQIIFRFYNFLPAPLRDLPGIELLPGNMDVRAYFRTIQTSSRWHFGLAPLTDNPFNRCKSDIKFVEYAAMGIPGLYSAVHPYLGVVQHGINGLLVQPQTSEAWYDGIAWMITHPEERQQLGQNAYQYVSSNRTLQGNLERWYQVYRSVAAQTNPQKFARPDVRQTLPTQAPPVKRPLGIQTGGRADKLLETLLDSDDIAIALQIHDNALDSDLLSLIRANARIARREGQADLASGLDNLSTYIEAKLNRQP